MSKVSRIVALLLVICLLAAAGAILLIKQITSPDVWLPDQAAVNAKQQFTDLPPKVYELPVKAEKVNTKYGAAMRYTTTAKWAPENTPASPWTTIYEFQDASKLQVSSCPDITDAESLLSSGCTQLGTFQGSSVYRINRSLPSGTTEYYTVVKGLFIYIKQSGDGGASLNYLKTFKQMPQRSVAGYIANNSQEVDKALATQPK